MSSAASTPRGYISWTVQEKTKLAEKFASLSEMPFYSNESKLNIFNKAQEVLPVGRRRKIAGLSQIKWLTSFVEEVKPNTSEKEADAEDIVNPVDSTSVIPDSISTDALLRMLIERASDVIKNIAEESIKEALNSIDLESAISSSIASILSGREIQDSRKKSKAEKPTITVVNLLPAQQREIRENYENLFDLRFWVDGEDSYSTLKSLCASSERVFAMTDKMKHNVDKIIVSVNKENYVRFTGGISSLKVAMEKYFCEV